MAFIFKETLDQVGKAHLIPEIQEWINKLKAEWDNLQTQKTVWYKPWQKLGTATLVKVTNFLIQALDELVAYISEHQIPGEDKKATVMAAISALYDYVVKGALPIWLVPFAGAVKSYIIDTLISSAIDWIVLKYKTGSWRPTVQSLN